MSNAFTSTAADTLGTSLVQAAYDRYIRYALRSTPMLRMIADSRPVQQAMPGSSVVFQFYADLAVATTELSELIDPDAVAIPSTSNVTVTLREYGNVVLTTEKLRMLALSDVDPAIANIVAYNLRDSVDEIVKPIVNAGTNVIRMNGGVLKSNLITGGSGTTGAVTAVAGDTMNSSVVRLATTKLRGGKVIPRNGDRYMSMIHPDVSHDLRAETGSGGWLEPHVHSAPSSIWDGNIGVYNGMEFVESPRMYSATDGGSSARVYRTLFFGREALAEAVATEFGMRIGNVTDKLLRNRPVGWYGLSGWSLFRQAALIRGETWSSVAA